MTNLSFIQSINASLKDWLDQYTNVRLLDLAESAIRGTDDQLQQYPIILNTAEAIDPNDTFDFTIYHKQNSVSISEKPGGSYGDQRALKVYSYSNVMIVHINGLTVKKTPDEVLLFLEANFPDKLRMDKVKDINIQVQTVVLNTLNVFNTEYKNVPYRLPLNYYMMAVYYKVEALFDKQCLPKC